MFARAVRKAVPTSTLGRLSARAAARPGGWGALAWVLLAAGVAASIVLGGFWRDEARRHAAQSFDTQAASVGSTVTTALRRMDDLTVAARSLVESEPSLKNADLAAWYRSVDARRRYPGTLGFGFLQFVPASGLGSYAAQIRSDPIPGMRPPRGAIKILPGGSRPFYCLARLGVNGIVNRLIPGGYGLDVCAIPGVGSMATSRDSGQFSTFSSTLVTGEEILTVSAPVYRGGVPQTTAGRRARILGWITGVFDVTKILGQAVAGDPRLAVTVSRQEPEAAPAQVDPQTTLSPVSRVASVGNSAGASLKRRFALEADGRWLVTVTGRADTGPFSPTLQGAAVFTGGLVTSALIFLLLQVLARGRARALRLVEEKTEQLHHQALHDALTGLPNRALIMDRANQMWVRSRRERSAEAVLFIDVDKFKAVNDTFGHLAGDQLLRAIGARIRGVLRDSDTVGRFGGDEFVVLAEGASLVAGPELVAQRILDVLRAPFDLDAVKETDLSVSVSIGIAAGQARSVDDLLREADIALYEAKAKGRDRYVVFSREMDTAAHDRLALEHELRRGIDANEFALVYQPTFDLARGTVNGVEALLRWHHPRRGVLVPDDFIPIAEETGLIIELGRWVIHAACERAASWHARGFELDLSVNVSARQLDDPGLDDTVREALSASGLDPRSLVLEITETTLMRDADSAVRRLRALKQLGVRIAIDDFGTGYSSLAYLQQFPVDSIKIDRAFISGIANSGEGKTLIHTLVQLGKTLSLDTVAEGIEEHDQLRHLRAEACDSGQGFLLARPLEPEVMDSFLARNWPRSSRVDRVRRRDPYPRALGSEGS